MSWELVKDGKVIKTHPTELACQIEAIERGYVVQWSADFIGDTAGKTLTEGAIIRRSTGVDYEVGDEESRDD